MNHGMKVCLNNITNNIYKINYFNDTSLQRVKNAVVNIKY